VAEVVLPVARFLIPCERVEWDLAPRKYNVFNPLVELRPPDGSGLPFRLSECWVYAQLFGGQGVVHLDVELRYCNTDAMVHRARPFRVDCGQGHRLTVRRRAVACRNVRFRQTGLHERRLLGNGREVIVAPIVLELTP
jgi:hypothetical protein